MAVSITSAMRTQVSQLYVSLFGRAPDGEGLGFWASALANGTPIATVAQQMYDSTPARAYYPSFLTNQEIVEKFYVNVLGRTPDADGLAFWLKAMNVPTATKGGVIASMIDAVNSYAGTDAAGVDSKALFANKVAVADYYGLQNLAVGSGAILVGVTSDPSSVVTAKATIDNPVVAAQTFTLTSNVDNGSNFTGGAGADSFNAALTTGGLNTLGNLDALVGGSGVDTLNAEMTGSATITPLSLSGIENVVVNFAGSTPTLALSNAASLTSVSAQTSAVNGIFTGIAAGATLNVLDQAANVTFGYAVTTGTQSATLNVSNVTTNSVITIAGIETITVNSTGAANAIDLTATSATTLNVTGDKNLTLDDLGTAAHADALTSINAASFSGALDMGVAGVAIVSITGGSGNDKIYGTASVDNVIAGNAGNDTITLAANLTSADTIGGGDGTDILSVSGGSADTAFTNITSVETLTLASGGATTTLGTAAQAAGIVTINGSTASEIITATAYTVGLTFNGLDSSGATDSVTLGSGDDVFVYAGNLLLSSDDSLNGGAGTDTVRIDNSAGSVTISVDFASFLNIEQIVVYDANGTATATAESINITLTAASVTSGTVGISTILVDGSAITDASDSMNFTAVGMVVATNGLKVSVLGGAGNDTIVGSTAADTLTGNAGNDSINGGSGADSITGGDGNDTIDGETGNDVITGGDGNDSITAAVGSDNLNGGNGSDTLIMSDNLSYLDTIAGGDGVDILSVSETVDDIDFLNVSGIETYSLASAGTTVTLGAYAQAAGIVTINGSTASDIITATAYTVGLTFNGLDSSAATDSVTLGTGDDIFVYAGNLLLSSNDSLNGGAGTDTVRIDNSAGAVTISVDFAKFINIEQIVVYDANGTATGTAESINITLTAASVTTGAIGISTISVDGSAITDAADSMNFTAAGMVVATNGLKVSVLGGAGNDTIIGSTGADTISGGDGNDSLTGGSGADSITGGAGLDALIGQTGNDVLLGGDGNDTLTGATGNDTLTGGAGNDTFAMTIANTTKLLYDTITDLTVGDTLSFTGGIGSVSTTFTSTAISTTNLTWTEVVNLATVGDGTVTTNISWFSWGGNTYVVADNSLATTGFIDGTDTIVEITGIVNLQASFAATSAGATTIVIS